MLAFPCWALLPLESLHHFKDWKQEVFLSLKSFILFFFPSTRVEDSKRWRDFLLLPRHLLSKEGLDCQSVVPHTLRVPPVSA